MELTVLYLHPIDINFTISFHSKDKIFYGSFNNGIIKKKLTLDFPIRVNVYNKLNKLVLTTEINIFQKRIELYNPINSIKLDGLTRHTLGSEPVICQRDSTHKTGIFLYFEKKTDYDSLNYFTVKDNNIAFRESYTFYRDDFHSKTYCIDYPIKNFNHRILKSPTNGVINVLNNVKTTIKVLTRDGIVKNPLNGTFVGNLSGENGLKTLLFIDDNYFSNRDRPRFLYDHERDNQLCLNREDPEFFQKRIEPELKYFIYFDKKDIVKQYDIHDKRKDSVVLILKPNSIFFLSINREIETEFNNKNYFLFNDDIIGEIV